MKHYDLFWIRRNWIYWNICLIYKTSLKRWFQPYFIKQKKMWCQQKNRCDLFLFSFGSGWIIYSQETSIRNVCRTRTSMWYFIIFFEYCIHFFETFNHGFFYPKFDVEKNDRWVFRMFLLFIMMLIMVIDVVGVVNFTYLFLGFFILASTKTRSISWSFCRLLNKSLLTAAWLDIEGRDKAVIRSVAVSWDNL